MAKSFPQPPAPLFFIFKTTAVCPAPIVKTKPYCVQLGVEVPVIFPVLPDCKRIVSVAFQISKETLIGIPVPEQPPEAAL